MTAKRDREGEWRKSQLDDVGRRRGAAVNRQEAVYDYRTIKGYVTLLREQGLSYQAIANILNKEGHITRRGKSFQKVTVMRLLERDLRD